MIRTWFRIGRIYEKRNSLSSLVFSFITHETESRVIRANDAIVFRKFQWRFVIEDLMWPETVVDVFPFL